MSGGVAGATFPFPDDNLSTQLNLAVSGNEPAIIFCPTPRRSEEGTTSATKNYIAFLSTMVASFTKEQDLLAAQNTQERLLEILAEIAKDSKTNDNGAAHTRSLLPDCNRFLLGCG